MPATIEILNEARRQLLDLNEGIKGPSLILAVIIVLGPKGFYLEVRRRPSYGADSVPSRVLGIPVVQVTD